MRIGVFGGEFDPPHSGHLTVVRTARDQLELDRVLIVPTGTPPHRPASATSAAARLRMAELAFAGEPKVTVSRMEVDRPGPSYTVDTLRALAQEGDLYLILGADQVATLAGWHQPEQVQRLAQLVVAPRDGLEASAHDITMLDMAPVDVSSTGARELLASGQGEPDVPAAVLAYIREHGLYA
jgi:nicotinate-nucleotide adenylyltransferase